MLKFTGRMPEPRTGDQTLCEPAQSKCIWRFHKNHLCHNLQVKCRGPEPRPTLCASLRSRNALGRFTRAVFFGGNLQGKCTNPDAASSAHCLGNSLYVYIYMYSYLPIYLSYLSTVILKNVDELRPCTCYLHCREDVPSEPDATHADADTVDAMQRLGSGCGVAPSSFVYLFR